MTSVPRGVALAFAVAFAATLVMAAPVIRAPGARVFGSGEILGRDDPNRDPLVVIHQFRTGHVPSPYLQPLTDLPGRLLARAVGPVAAYNVIVLATFPLAAAASYLLARHVFVPHPGAMAAALAYAFLPFHVVQAGGHPHVAQTQWIPLYFLALWRCVDRPGLARAGWLLAAAAAVALSNFYGGLIAATLSPVALLAYGFAGPARPEAGRLRRVAITASVLAGAAVIGVVLVARLTSPAPLHAFDRAELFVWSAKWWSYLVPSAEHPWWGTGIQAFWARHGVAENAIEHQQVGLTWGLIALAGVPLWRLLRGDREAAHVRIAPVLAILAAFAVLCSLSPERQIGSLLFVRPSALLYELAPMFRAYARFGVVAGLMTALLAGAGVASLWPRRASRTVALALLALAMIEVAPFPPWRWRAISAEATLPVPGPAPAGALEVPADGSPVYVGALLGFHARESDGDRQWRWMAQTGALRVVATARAPETAIDLELRSFPGPRRIEWLLGGRRMGSLEVTPQWGIYRLALGDLDSGSCTLTLASSDAAIPADAILHNGDPRPLALALSRWTIVGPGSSTPR